MATSPSKHIPERSPGSSKTKVKDTHIVPGIKRERSEKVAAVAPRVTPCRPRVPETSRKEELTPSATTEPAASTAMPSTEPYNNSSDLSPLPPLNSAFYSHLILREGRHTTRVPPRRLKRCTSQPGRHTPSKCSGALGSPSGTSPQSSYSRSLITQDKNNAPPPSRPVFSASSTTENNSRRGLILVAIVIACAVLIFAIYGTIRFLKPRREIPTALEGPMCRTRYCGEVALLSELMLNTSIDPCTDMKARTCSAPTNFIKGHKHGTKLMTLSVTYQALRFDNMLRWAERQLSLLRHLASVYKACMADVTDGESAEGIRKLRKFMSQLNIPWLTAPSLGLDALDVLLNLAFNWRVELWFGLNVVRNLDGSKNIIVGGESSLRVWLDIHDSVEASNAHRAQWNGFVSKFAPGPATVPAKEFDADFSVNDYIFKELSGVLRVRLPKPVQFVVRDAQSHTRSISAQHWMRALNDRIKLYGPFVFSDSITFRNAVLLKALDRIFTKHSSSEILKHLSWIFLQMYGPIADRRLLSITYGNEEEARSRRPIFCAEQVTAAYPGLIESLYVLRYFNSSTRATIDRQLASIKNAALSKVAGLAWADEAFRQEISQKLEKLAARIWPPKHLLTEHGISQVFASWFSSSANQSFIESWLSAVLKRSVFRDNASLTAFMQKEPRPFTVPFIMYDYFLNEVPISAVALSFPDNPIFGIKALGYGALGLVYATQLVKVFDDVGIRVDAHGRLRPNDSWVSVGTKKALATRDGCLNPALESTIPEVPALEIAHAAFEDSFGADSAARSMRVVSGLNEEQLFFVAACVSMCSNRETLPSIRLDCNKAVMNFAPFARAFNCSPNSAMNPSRKCPYLN